MGLTSSLKSSFALCLALSTFAAGQLASYGPGQFGVSASDAPFLSGQGTSFFLRPSDGLFCVQTEQGMIPLTANYNRDASYNPYGVKPGPCSPAEACQVFFQSDGNLVQYYNGAAVWQSGTSGSGASLTFYPSKLYAFVQNAAGTIVWQSNPVGGPPGGCYGPSDVCH